MIVSSLASLFESKPNTFTRVGVANIIYYIGVALGTKLDQR